MTYEETKETSRSSGSILQPLAIAALVVALGAMAFVQVNMRHEQERTNRMIGEMNEKQQARIETLEQRAATLEQEATTLNSQGTSTSAALRETQKRLAATKAATFKKIDSQIEQTKQ